MKRNRVGLCGGLAVLAGAVAACGSSPTGLRTASTADAGCALGECASASSLPPVISEASGSSADAGCVPQPGPDLPDDNFTDTNCDGIDGDKNAAIFVAPAGSDSADGSFGHPVQTIGVAVKLALTASKAVYACNATYAEAITLAGAVSLYGGYDCANGWRRIADVFALAPPTGVPLAVNAVTQAMTVDHAKLVAADATTPGGSSIGCVVSGATAVTFHEVTFQAGAGAAGPDGAPVAAVTTRATDGEGGESFAAWQWCLDNPSTPTCLENMVGGSTSNTPACEGHGGRGGDGFELHGGPTPTPPGGPNDVNPLDANTRAVGSAGANGAAGAQGTQTAPPYGTFSSTGFTPNDGTDGAPGAPGQGGSGGWGGALGTLWTDDYSVSYTCTIEVGGGGGEGGYGGCGGAGGHGGGGGGASVGLIAAQSGVTLTGCTFDTSAGGAGGAGSAGAAGQPGGVGGLGATGMVCSKNASLCAQCPADSVSGGETDDGQNGAAGGVGGAGGAGNAGAGGPSIGIVSLGIAATTESAVFNLGAGGPGGTSLVASAIGNDGLSAPMLGIGVPDAGASPDGNFDGAPDSAADGN